MGGAVGTGGGGAASAACACSCVCVKGAPGTCRFDLILIDVAAAEKTDPVDIAPGVGGAPVANNGAGRLAACETGALDVPAVVPAVATVDAGVAVVVAAGGAVVRAVVPDPPDVDAVPDPPVAPEPLAVLDPPAVPDPPATGLAPDVDMMSSSSSSSVSVKCLDSLSAIGDKCSGATGSCSRTSNSEWKTSSTAPCWKS